MRRQRGLFGALLGVWGAFWGACADTARPPPAPGDAGADECQVGDTCTLLDTGTCTGPSGEARGTAKCSPIGGTWQLTCDEGDSGTVVTPTRCTTPGQTVRCAREGPGQPLRLGCS